MEDVILGCLAAGSGRTAVVWRDQSFDFQWLHQESMRLETALAARPDCAPGTVVALRADYSPRSIALLLALLRRRCLVALLTPAFDAQRSELYRLAEVETEAYVDPDDQLSFTAVGGPVQHPLLRDLAAQNRSALILFSSGSAGKIKAVVHDGDRLLLKYHTRRKARITIPFMLFDHIGGVNTVLQVLTSGGTAVLAPDRSPETICRLIEEHRVEVLPTTPTFLNLLLLSDYARYDLSSLRVLAYGAERMPESALSRLASIFPNVELVQNYGLSEVGILHTKSESSGSLWMKLGGDGYQTRVRDGLLEIKAQTAMVGYLNEESPFTEDGWLRTGDRVEVKGEYLRILGRASAQIIIGGEKVYPAEVEDLIAELPGVIEVVVSGEPNAITGQIVKAEVRLSTAETRAEFKTRLQAYLADRLLPYKIPQRVTLSQAPLHTARFKKRTR